MTFPWCKYCRGNTILDSGTVNSPAFPSTTVHYSDAIYNTNSTDFAWIFSGSWNFKKYLVQRQVMPDRILYIIKTITLQISFSVSG